MEVNFTINGKPYNINAKTVPVDTSLNTFLRNNAQLRGTKFMCLEGGCGACIVTVSGAHPVTKKYQSWGVNSCLTPIFSCHGLDITTIEGVGNRKIGYHKIQKRLAHFNGTQCGYCSPGMVMNMHSLLESKDGKVTMKDVENSFGGNICRCTGYRPILDAFKSFATDADPKLIEACMDIEDLTKTCPKTGSPCAGSCHQNGNGGSPSLSLTFDDKKQWFKVFSTDELFNILAKTSEKPYMLVAGNTAHGVYRRSNDIQTFIDITGVEELRKHSIGKDIVIGGNTSLTETMEILTEASKKSCFNYCTHLVNHIDLIANVPVRNNGTIAGNLSIKHGNIEFPSDLYIILEAAGAKLTIAESTKTTKLVSVEQYLSLDMKGKIILNVILPPLDPQIFTFRSYKIMPRAQNAHAYVNAAFLIEHQNDKIKSARICFGGIEPKFTHAVKTEKQLLTTTDLYTNENLLSILKTLKSELNPDWVLPDATPEYRQTLALSLFYKFVINTCPENKINPKYKSGGEILNRPISSGTQVYDTFEDRWPLTQPVPKYEGLIQTAGELEFVNDLPTQPNELWAAFVPATEVHAIIKNIDATEALKLPGVHYFFSAKDIPGDNAFYPLGFDFFGQNKEEIFLSEDGPCLFHGQPAGIILADSLTLANQAVNLVKISYEKDTTGKQIITNLHDAHEKKAVHLYGDLPFKKVATKYGENATKKVTGTFDIGAQYHYTMETQTTICLPAEDGIDVLCATQWIDFTQVAVAQCLKLPCNSVNMLFRRIGGGYGAKISRPALVACAAAIGCHLTNRPVRFVLTIESNMSTMGKRYALLSEYDIDVDNSGKIQKLTNTYSQDFGCNLNEPCPISTDGFLKGCYNIESWDVVSKSVVTNAPSHTWCRAPGSTEAIAMTENIMEHIASVTGLDPIAVRLANMEENNKLAKLIPDFIKDTDFEKRRQEVQQFNRSNRWRKRGIAICPMDYPQHYFGTIPVLVAVYHTDGTVVVTHGGIECGQGINTKAAQVAAHVLGVPYESVSVKRMNNVLGANSGVTGGSMTSEAVCHAIKRACEVLNERIQPVRDELKEKNPSWKELIAKAYSKDIDLTSKYLYKSSDLKTYNTYGLTCCELEIDLLTGNLHLNRVDILEDTGESLSPNVDVGQVEGAFIMGIGYWLHESLIYKQDNGELLSNRTWTYKPPGVKDIPIDFRVRFLQKNHNEFGVLRSKATGEPPLCMSVVVLFALRQALESARADAGIQEKWFELGAPSTPDILFLKAGNSIENYKLN